MCILQREIHIISPIIAAFRVKRLKELSKDASLAQRHRIVFAESKQVLLSSRVSLLNSYPKLNADKVLLRSAKALCTTVGSFFQID